MAPPGDAKKPGAEHYHGGEQHRYAQDMNGLYGRNNPECCLDRLTERGSVKPVYEILHVSCFLILEHGIGT